MAKNLINACSYENIQCEFPLLLKLILLRQIIEIKRENTSDIVYGEVFKRLSRIIKLKGETNIGNLSTFLKDGIEVDHELNGVLDLHFDTEINNLNIPINLEEFDNLDPINTLLVTRFLVASNKYDYTNSGHSYFINEIVHLFTSPIKQFDCNTMSNILNLENFKISEKIELINN